MLIAIEAKLMLRDNVLAKMLDHIVGEGVGQFYLDAVAEADRLLNAELEQS